ncbi:hypothetical protein [Prosthecobacter dejongeii]|nr:hypothetical protein [Prosthecobacter dejongeii]
MDLDAGKSAHAPLGVVGDAEVALAKDPEGSADCLAAAFGAPVRNVRPSEASFAGLVASEVRDEEDRVAALPMDLEAGKVRSREANAHGPLASLDHGLPPSLDHALTPTLDHALTPTLDHDLTPSLDHGLTASLDNPLTPHPLTCRTVLTEEREGRAWVVAEEAALFATWRAAHGMPDIPVALLPRLGVVALVDGVETAAGWLYMDNSVGVGFVEWLVTRPGLSLAQSRAALAAVLATLKAEAAGHGYSLLLGHCIAPLARVAIQSLGWQDMGSTARCIGTRTA